MRTFKCTASVALALLLGGMKQFDVNASIIRSTAADSDDFSQAVYDASALFHYIRTADDGVASRCIEPNDWTNSLVLGDCSEPQHAWRLEKDGGDSIRFHSRLNDSYCIQAAPNEHLINGSDVFLYPCSDNPLQHFRWIDGRIQPAEDPTLCVAYEGGRIIVEGCDFVDVKKSWEFVRSNENTTVHTCPCFDEVDVGSFISAHGGDFTCTATDAVWTEFANGEECAVKDSNAVKFGLIEFGVARADCPGQREVIRCTSPCTETFFINQDQGSNCSAIVSEFCDSLGQEAPHIDPSYNGPCLWDTVGQEALRELSRSSVEDLDSFLDGSEPIRALVPFTSLVRTNLERAGMRVDDVSDADILAALMIPLSLKRRRGLGTAAPVPGFVGLSDPECLSALISLALAFIDGVLTVSGVPKTVKSGVARKLAERIPPSALSDIAEAAGRGNPSPLPVGIRLAEAIFEANSQITFSAVLDAVGDVISPADWAIVGMSIMAQLAAVWASYGAYLFLQNVQWALAAAAFTSSVATFFTKCYPKGGTGSSFGEPHIITFDGVSYDCHGRGEFGLFRTLDGPYFEVQARYDYRREVDQRVTVGRGFAIASEGSPTIELSIPRVDPPTTSATNLGSCVVHFYVDGRLTDLAEGTSEHGNASVQVSGRNAVLRWLIDGSVGPTLSIRSFSTATLGCILNANIFVPDSFSSISTIVGLMGTPNGDFTDDWTDPMGQPIALPITQSERLHQTAYDYCTSNWCIREEAESLFIHEIGSSFDDVSDCDAPYPGGVNLGSATTSLIDLCGTNEACLIDGIAVGDESVAQNALEEQAVLAESIAFNPFRFAPSLIKPWVSHNVTITVDLRRASMRAFDVESYEIFRIDTNSLEVDDAPIVRLLDTGSGIGDDKEALDLVFSNIVSIRSDIPGESFGFRGVPVVDGFSDPTLSAFVFSSLHAVQSYSIRSGIGVGSSNGTKCSVTSNFSSGSEGWRSTCDGDVFIGGDLEHIVDGGNPGGHISAGLCFWWSYTILYAPEKFHGNFEAAYGRTLSFDVKIAGDIAGIRVTIFSGQGPKLRFFWDFELPNNDNFTSYSLRLDGSNIRPLAGSNIMIEEQIRTSLQDITDILFLFSFREREGTVYLDNVRLDTGC